MTLATQRATAKASYSNTPGKVCYLVLLSGTQRTPISERATAIC
jgi:hypothetical protein